jgi:predicted enzyme related to lactoylglutathione lyase
MARKPQTGWALLALCVIAALASVTALAFELPPLNPAPSSEHHPGKIVWVDLVTTDLGAAKTFYGGLFGWTFNDVHVGSTDYSVALLDGEPVGGIVERKVNPDQQRHPAWVTFISVRNVDRTQQSIVANGGRVLSPAHTYPKRGRQAVFADPQGAVFAVLQSASGDPQDALASPGEWIWSSLSSHDAGKEAAFYQNVFGYEAFDLPDEDGLEHVLLATDHYARASSNALPAEATSLHPHWLNFVRVTNTAAAVAKVESLGGRVLVPPHEDRHGGQVAVVADPTGAPFGLLEWTAADDKQVAR